MKRFLFSVLILACLARLAHAGGDTIELRDGKKISGNIIAQGEGFDLSPHKRSVLFNSKQIYIDTEDGLQKIDLTEIKSIQFGPKTFPQNSSPAPSPSTSVNHP
jgi:hypothetical protein